MATLGPHTDLGDTSTQYRRERGDRREVQRRSTDDKNRASDGSLTPREIAAKSLVPIFLLNLVIVVALFFSHTQQTTWQSALGIQGAIGAITGLIGTFLILVQLALIGRFSWLDRAVGMDRLIKWHKNLGKPAFFLLTAHVVFATLASRGEKGIFHTIKTLVVDTRDILIATIAFGFICMVAITSFRMARRRMSYETWYFVHLYAYLGIALAVPHEIFLGSDFVGHLLTQIYWGILYSVCVGLFVYFRVGVPLWRNAKHRLRVAEVVQENEDTYSIYIEGRNLHKFSASPGQFLMWRFLTKDHWWQSHPYSLSAAPNEQFLRITVKNLGDGSGRLANIAVGVRVMFDGPYGIFTPKVRKRRKVVLIAGGIGVSPIRALAESIPARKGDITLIYRATKATDVVFEKEIVQIARARDMNLRAVIGSRERFSPDVQPFSPGHLLSLAPDVEESDVYICGPALMIKLIVKSLRSIGLKSSQIHCEEFEF